MTANKNDYVILWEPPKLEPPEFRLYYDETGKVICYSGDKSMDGNYIVIDTQTFIEGRHDIQVIGGKISRATADAVVYKLMPSDEDGTNCHPEDISIMVDETDEKQKWKLIVYEL